MPVSQANISWSINERGWALFCSAILLTTGNYPSKPALLLRGTSWAPSQARLLTSFHPEVSLVSVFVICDLKFIFEALGLTSVPLLDHKLHLEGTVALCLSSEPTMVTSVKCHHQSQACGKPTAPSSTHCPPSTGSLHGLLCECIRVC